MLCSWQLVLDARVIDLLLRSRAVTPRSGQRSHRPESTEVFKTILKNALLRPAQAEAGKQPEIVPRIATLFPRDTENGESIFSYWRRIDEQALHTQDYVGSLDEQELADHVLHRQRDGLTRAELGQLATKEVVLKEIRRWWEWLPKDAQKFAKRNSFIVEFIRICKCLWIDFDATLAKTWADEAWSTYSVAGNMDNSGYIRYMIDLLRSWLQEGSEREAVDLLHQLREAVEDVEESFGIEEEMSTGVGRIQLGVSRSSLKTSKKEPTSPRKKIPRDQQDAPSRVRTAPTRVNFQQTPSSPRPQTVKLDVPPKPPATTNAVSFGGGRRGSTLPYIPRLPLSARLSHTAQSSVSTLANTRRSASAPRSHRSSSASARSSGLLEDKLYTPRHGLESFILKRLVSQVRTGSLPSLGLERSGSAVVDRLRRNEAESHQLLDEVPERSRRGVVAALGSWADEADSARKENRLPRPLPSRARSRQSARRIAAAAEELDMQRRFSRRTTRTRVPALAGLDPYTRAQLRQKWEQSSLAKTGGQPTARLDLMEDVEVLGETFEDALQAVWDSQWLQEELAVEAAQPAEEFFLTRGPDDPRPQTVADPLPQAPPPFVHSVIPSRPTTGRPATRSATQHRRRLRHVVEPIVPVNTDGLKNAMLAQRIANHQQRLHTANLLYRSMAPYSTLEGLQATTRLHTTGGDDDDEHDDADDDEHDVFRYAPGKSATLRRGVSGADVAVAQKPLRRTLTR